MLPQTELSQIRLRLAKLLGVKVLDKRITSIFVNSSYHWQPSMRIEVGKSYANLEPESPREEVIAIFESTVFCVCTVQRGGEKGLPYLFHKTDVTKVEFEEG